MTEPVLEPVEELILQDIETALASIATDHPSVEYWNDIIKVTRAQTNIGNGSMFPVLNLWPSHIEISDDLAQDTHSVNSEAMHLIVEGWLSAIVDAPKLLHRMNRDIRTALVQDATRNALAIHTFIVKSDFWYPENSTQPLAVVDCEVVVRYRTQTDSLETAT